MLGFNRIPHISFPFTNKICYLHTKVPPPAPPAPSIHSVYMRKLPPSLIQLNSSYGKQIFSEALKEGNMECFFPLMDQFTTQYKPSTCGTTTLTMILNSLGIDPKVIWKGIWRWFTEESLACSHPDYLNEIDIEKFTHLAKRNYSSIQMFYHNSIQNLSSFNKSIMECPSGNHSSTSIITKMACFETFFDCCVASSRRDGFFLVTNSSRKALNQTGFGHFSPIGGVNLSKKLVLIMDVARYKYPTYWCEIRRLFDSLEEVDTATQKPRGFCLITKSYQNYARICRETEDFLSIENVKTRLMGFVYEDMKRLEEWELIKDVMMNMLKRFNDDYRWLLVHYLFELTTRIDPDQTPHHERYDCDGNPYENGFGEKYVKKFKEQFKTLKISEICREIKENIENDKDLKRIIWLIKDFHPHLIEEIIGVLIFAMPWNCNTVKGIFKGREGFRKKMSEYERKIKEMNVIQKEVDNLKLNMGFDEY